jgi:K+-transporting ATPase ATPase A chain
LHWRWPTRTSAIACSHVKPTGGWLQIGLFVAIVGLLTRPLGGYLARVYAGERTLLRPLIGPVEAALYRLAGVQPEGE